MKDLAPYLGPLLAMIFIVRRGFKPQRIKANRLWTYPAIITVLAFLTLWHGKPPGLGTLGIYLAAILAGGALGWFTTQHLELTLDDKTGTIMSKPTPIGTALTAAVFVARFAVDLYLNGGPGHGVPRSAFAAQHGSTLVWVADAGLLFVAARGLARAWHLWIRTRPLLEQHKAAQLPPVQ